MFLTFTLMLMALTASAQSCPDSNHPHAIDLGLPSGTKWACCNVEATKPTDYGGYYAWGETEEKKVYNDVTYKYSSGEDTDGDGWYDKNWQSQNIGKSICGTQYDVAHVKWGGPWIMPSFDQIMELIDNTTSTNTTINGIDGYLFKGTNGGSVFLPTAGWRADTLDGCGILSYYWSGEQDSSYVNRAYCMTLDDWAYYSRCFGQSVRPVCK